MTITGMPGNPNRDRSRLEEVVVKIVDMENEVNDDIDRLIEAKKEIASVDLFGGIQWKKCIRMITDLASKNLRI